jgi:hypothetical protein
MEQRLQRCRDALEEAGHGVEAEADIALMQRLKDGMAELKRVVERLTEAQARSRGRG